MPRERGGGLPGSARLLRRELLGEHRCERSALSMRSTMARDRTARAASSSESWAKDTANGR